MHWQKNGSTADKMNILVVGDKAKILEGLQKLGYEIIELDTDGKPAEKESVLRIGYNNKVNAIPL